MPVCKHIKESLLMAVKILLKKKRFRQGQLLSLLTSQKKREIVFWQVSKSFQGNKVYNLTPFSTNQSTEPVCGKEQKCVIFLSELL